MVKTYFTKASLRNLSVEILPVQPGEEAGIPLKSVHGFS